MAQHAILRFEKHKGNPARPLEAHHERQKEQYASNPDIDTSRSKYNFHIVKPESRYYHFIQNRIEQAGCRTRKDSTRFVDTLITASPEFFKKKPPKEIQEFFHRAADFLIGRVGRENIVSAVVHMDEKTPHLHLVFVPLTEDNRLCAKEIIGNRANLTKWQDDFHAYMVEKYPDLERGESASKTGRKHIPTRLFKQAVNLSKQARAIEATLDGITPFNAGKKKEEALSLLKKWFPQMENFSGQLKKYKVTINDLLAENEQLEARVKASEKGKMKDTMERAKLESEYRPWLDFAGLPFYGRGAGWQRQLHIYEVPFYYIDYCLAQTVALQFFTAFLHDKKDAWRRYLALVGEAGGKTYPGLVAAAGLDSPFAPGTLAKLGKEVGAWIAAQDAALNAR